MHHVAIPRAVLGALLIGVLAMAGTAGACKETADTPKVVLVDCKRLCKKTFSTCGREVFIKSGKLRVDKARLFKVLHILEKVKAEGLESCLKSCGEHRGTFSDGEQVNRCLEIEGCDAFAACITKYIR